MAGLLAGKNVVLGVTGSIACYKSADLASKLIQLGAQVDVILSHSAMEFITPLTFRSLTHRHVFTELFDSSDLGNMEHIAIAERADIVVVAPATANFIAKITAGLAGDMLATTILATRSPVIVAPAMDGHMYDNPATQENIQKLRQRGFHIAGPSSGRLASGLVGPGRLIEIEALIGHIRTVLGYMGDLAGKTVVVTAGGTQEPIDPVRVVANLSSGKMGYALAEAARDRGAQTTLVTAPTAFDDPVGIAVTHVKTAMEMRDAVCLACHSADVLIMAAAVADYRPVRIASQKIKKAAEEWTLEMTRTPDILQEATGGLIGVGFAAESERVVENAREKLIAKDLDIIVANDVTAPGSAFAADTNKVVIIDRYGREDDLPLLSKYDVATHILDRVKEMLDRKT